MALLSTPERRLQVGDPVMFSVGGYNYTATLLKYTATLLKDIWVGNIAGVARILGSDNIRLFLVKAGKTILALPETAFTFIGFRVGDKVMLQTAAWQGSYSLDSKSCEIVKVTPKKIRVRRDVNGEEVLISPERVRYPE